MSVLTALVIVLTVIATLDTLLTVGIVRRLRSSPELLTQKMPPYLSPGFRIDPGRDEFEWPQDLLTLLHGDWIVVLALVGCPGCNRVREEIAEIDGLRPSVCVIVDSTSGTPEALSHFLAQWKANLQSISPAPFEVMHSFGGGPAGYPAIILLNNGVVRATGSRLHHLRPYLVEDRVDQ